LHLTPFFKCVDVIQRNILKIFVRNKKTEEDKTKSGGKCEQWFENVQTGSYRLNLERCEPKNFTGEVDAEERRREERTRVRERNGKRVPFRQNNAKLRISTSE
jgi:hypothetical protein